MKYGRLVHIGFSKSTETKGNRLMSMGDLLENLALERVYERMGVIKDEIINCYPYEIDSYKGEYIVVPINIYTLTVDFSNRILPVFIGLTVGGSHDFSERELNILRKSEPVGCRDERTMHRLINNGIDAYFAGCMVATFPAREQNLPTQETVFFVDPQAGILDYIPDILFENYKFFSHDFYSTPDELGNGKVLTALAEDVLEMYSKEAKLIVTSKFHAAITALALGIPVILIIENCYYKYTWIQKYIPVYEPKDFANIDWNPPIVQISDEEKELMVDIACKRLTETYEKYKQICTLSEIRENVHMTKYDDIFYGSYAVEYIKNNWSKDEKIEYAFWGATATAVKLYEIISTEFPKAKLIKVFDFIVRNEFLGMIPISSSEICKYKELFIFVTGNSASEQAKDLFLGTQKPRDRYFLCERKVLQEKDVKGRMNNYGND